MSDYNAEIEQLQKYLLLPSMDLIQPSRFISNYKTPEDLWWGIASPITQPIFGLITSLVEALRSVWGILRFIGNVLILKFNDAGTALQDASVYFVLSLAVALTSPVNAALYTIELLTRVVTSWFTPEESDANLLQTGFSEKFTNKADGYVSSNLLPSENYLKRMGFFNKYSTVSQFFVQVAKPVIKPVTNVGYSFEHVVFSVIEALYGVSYLLIGQPMHAGEAFLNTSVEFSLSVALAVMAPVNALVNTIPIATRLGSTWYDAVFSSDEVEPESLVSMNF